MQRIISDQQALLSKNEGDVLQNIVLDLWNLLQELKQNPELKHHFEDWQISLTSLFHSGDFTQFFAQTGGLFTSIRETDDFLALVSESIDLIKILLAESTEKVH